MEQLNSASSRATNARQNMVQLEKAILVADQRLVIRRDIAVNSRVFLQTLFLFPLTAYMVFQWFSPLGVMHNYKSSSGASFAFFQNALQRQKSTTEIYRPEMLIKEEGAGLSMYSKRMAE